MDRLHLRLSFHQEDRWRARPAISTMGNAGNEDDAVEGDGGSALKGKRRYLLAAWASAVMPLACSRATSVAHAWAAICFRLILTGALPLGEGRAMTPWKGMPVAV